MVTTNSNNIKPDESPHKQSKATVIEHLLYLLDGDDVTIDVEQHDSSLSGTVSRWMRSVPDQHRSGNLTVEIDLDLDHRDDLPTRHITILADEPRRGHWGDASAIVHAPEVTEGEIARDGWQVLGFVTEVSLDAE